jgi:hypothetical protein
MAEHMARIGIARPAEEVFAFLANPTNLPRWQPMLREAFREAPEQIRVIGGGVGAAGMAEHVRFVADHAARHLCWATPTGVGCAGDIRVAETEGGASVEIVLRLGQRADSPEALAQWTGDAELGLEAALRAGLVAVKAACEDRTTTVELVSGGAQSNPAVAPLRDSRAYGTASDEPPGG